jgi:hypothetical protein
VDVYRSEPREPQFICVVCYRSMSVHAGECPRCGVDRLPLGDAEVRAEVRAEAERRVQKRLYGEWFWLYLAAWVVTTPVRFLVGGFLPAAALWVIATLMVGSANVKLYERLNARSALRLFAERRRRFALASAPGGAGAQKLLPARADDPEDADLPHVLELLGARVEDPQTK